MKKLALILLSVLAVSFTACNKEKKEKLKDMEISDSLQHILDLRDAELNDLLKTFNDVQASLNEINEAENIIALASTGENQGSKASIKENILLIQDKMKQNKQMIEELQQQLRESTFKGDELKRTLQGLLTQLEEKDKKLTSLNKLLEEKETTITAQNEKITAQSEQITAHETTISEQNANITELNNKVDEQVAENTRNQETIAQQDNALNTAYYVFGTKSELKEQSILSKGEVLQGNYNKNYFKKIDIRTTKEIKLYSKAAKMLTNHPAGTYVLQKDINNQYVLKIIDAQRFWATSKYLVLQVR